MNGSRFDDLARVLALSSSRRRLIGGLLAGALGGLGVGAAKARSCSEAGRVCREHASCCSGFCGAKDATGRRRCACASPAIACHGQCVDPASAFQSDPNNCGACGNSCSHAQCQRPVCNGGNCGLEANPATNGRACDDGNPCTTGTTCQGGVCGGGSPVVCGPLDQCHDAGVCDRNSGLCSNPAKPDHAECDGGVCCGGICRGCCTGADCDDDEICTDDACVGNACTHTPIAGCCHDVSECSSPTLPCQEAATCENNRCGFQLKQAGVFCRAAGDECEEDAVCDGNEATCPSNPFKDAGSHCGVGPTCTGGVATLQSTCDGQGACQVGATKPCTPYLCDAAGTACLTGCGDDDDCLDSAYCAADNTCQDDLPDGQPCLADAQCLHGHCVGGVCCATTCPTPSQGTATCADGQTCDFACDGGYHRCGEACVSDASVTQCGTGCVDCTANVPANTAPACDGGICAYPCDTENGASACGSVCCNGDQECCDDVCKQKPTAACQDNDDCCSTVCVNGTCRETCREEDQTCDDDADCCTGICANIGATVGHCCASGVTCGPTCCADANATCCGDGCLAAPCDEDQCQVCNAQAGACVSRCPEGRVCDGQGNCVCPAGISPCGFDCIDTRSDPENCGGCGVDCRNGTICEGGQCVCPPGFDTCTSEANGRIVCTDRDTDPDNCGECGLECGAGNACVDGLCCPSGLSPCHRDVCEAITPEVYCCLDLSRNERSCGACGVQCAEGHQCIDGVCQGVCDEMCDLPMVCSDLTKGCACPPELATCRILNNDPYCADLDNDPNNCRFCGRACDHDLICADGGCCPENSSRCPSDVCGPLAPGADCCRDLSRDERACGDCRNRCADGHQCVGGVCQGDCDLCEPPMVCSPLTKGCVCPSDLHTCEVGGSNPQTYCADIRSDPENCGQCGRVCDEGEICSDGVCCPSGLAGCHGDACGNSGGCCVDLSTSELACGACDVMCAPGHNCQNGACV